MKVLAITLATGAALWAGSVPLQQCPRQARGCSERPRARANVRWVWLLVAVRGLIARGPTTALDRLVQLRAQLLWLYAARLARLWTAWYADSYGAGHYGGGERQLAAEQEVPIPRRPAQVRSVTDVDPAISRPNDAGVAVAIAVGVTVVPARAESDTRRDWKERPAPEGRTAKGGRTEGCAAKGARSHRRSA